MRDVDFAAGFFLVDPAGLKDLAAVVVAVTTTPVIAPALVAVTEMASVVTDLATDAVRPAMAVTCRTATAPARLAAPSRFALLADDVVLVAIRYTPR